MIETGHTKLNEFDVWSPRYTMIGNPKKTLDQIIKGLFSNGEKGIFLDPNDFSTMFQDSAGTIPVTAVGQPVALIMDKSGNNNHLRQTLNHQRPILRKNATTGYNYLELDGADDFLATGAINLTTAESVTVISSVRRTNNTVTGTFFEFSPNSSTINGSFSVLAPFGGGFIFSSRGTSISTATYATAPTPCLVVGEGSISTDTAKLRINGVEVVSSNVDQGVGTYGSHSAYIGRRAGTSQAFAGHIYSLLLIGRKLTSKELTSVESFLSKAINVPL